MKKSILLIASLLTLITASCSTDDPIWDWAPAIVYIQAEDAQGNDLIKGDMPGMSVTFQGETYPVTISDERVMTRAYYAHLYGLVFQEGKDWSSEPNAKNRLAFGELDGAKNMNEDIIVTWPDGSTNTIHYQGSKNKRSWKLDGKKHDGHCFKFVK